MPSFTADYFGARFMGRIYGWILLAWGVGSVISPIMIASLRQAHGPIHDRPSHHCGGDGRVAAVSPHRTAAPPSGNGPGAKPCPRFLEELRT